MKKNRAGLLLAISMVPAVGSIQSSTAIVNTQALNNSAQAFSTGTWSAFASSTSTLTPSGTSLGPITNSSASTCTFLTKTSTSLIVSKSLTLSDVNSLSVGMIVNSIPTGLNEINSINFAASSIGLKTGNPSAPIGTVFTFTISGCFSSYFSINNNGSEDILRINITQTTNTTTGRSMQLTSCDISGVGSAAATWDEINNTCSGTINTIMTTIGSGAGANSPQLISNYSLPITTQTSRRIRAVTTQSGATYTVSVSVDRSSIRGSNSSIG
jgi:hypothetical protein